MNTFERTMMLRDAGGVRRWHTESRWIGERQTVGHHTFGVLVILTQITPKEQLTPRLIKAALFHDLGERVVGDVPSPTKWWMRYQTGGNPLDTLEGNILQAAGCNIELTNVEHQFLDTADMLDFCFEATEQFLMGNLGLLSLFDRVEKRHVRNQQLMSISQEATELYDSFRAIWAHAREQQNGVLREIAGFNLRKLSDAMVGFGISNSVKTGRTPSCAGQPPNNANRPQESPSVSVPTDTDDQASKLSPESWVSRFGTVD
jgi:hypothetical protein